jgi:hypothetical protein
MSKIVVNPQALREMKCSNLMIGCSIKFKI